MGSVVKSGYMKKFSKSMLTGGWKQCYVVLHQDSNFCVYKKQGDSSAMGIIRMFDVRKWFAYGDHTDGMPDRPKLPAGTSVKQIIAIPEKPSSTSKILWFMCDTEEDTHAWMAAICQTLPTPEGKAQPQQQQAPMPFQSSGAPPPYPSPGLGFDNLVGQPPAPGPSGYPAQPYPQQMPPQAAYPQAAYPQAAYPQQTYPQQPPPPMQYQQPGMMGYPQQQFQQPYAPGYPQQAAYMPGYYAQPNVVYAHSKSRYMGQGYPGQPNVVYAQNQPQQSGGFMQSDGAKIAAGLAGGALLGYGASRLMGGGFGMFGLGRHGSWSSLSSFGSCGSFGSFGSFG